GRDALRHALVDALVGREVEEVDFECGLAVAHHTTPSRPTRWSLPSRAFGATAQPLVVERPAPRFCAGDEIKDPGQRCLFRYDLAAVPAAHGCDRRSFVVNSVRGARRRGSEG